MPDWLLSDKEVLPGYYQLYTKVAGDPQASEPLFAVPKATLGTNFPFGYSVEPDQT